MKKIVLIGIFLLFFLSVTFATNLEISESTLGTIKENNSFWVNSLHSDYFFTNEYSFLIKNNENTLLNSIKVFSPDEFSILDGVCPLKFTKNIGTDSNKLFLECVGTIIPNQEITISVNTNENISEGLYEWDFSYLDSDNFKRDVIVRVGQDTNPPDLTDLTFSNPYYSSHVLFDINKMKDLVGVEFLNVYKKVGENFVDISGKISENFDDVNSGNYYRQVSNTYLVEATDYFGFDSNKILGVNLDSRIRVENRGIEGGKYFTIYGEGFYPGSNVELTLNGNPLQLFETGKIDIISDNFVTVPNDGTFDVSVLMSKDYPIGKLLNLEAKIDLDTKIETIKRIPELKNAENVYFVKNNKFILLKEAIESQIVEDLKNVEGITFVSNDLNASFVNPVDLTKESYDFSKVFKLKENGISLKHIEQGLNGTIQVTMQNISYEDSPFVKKDELLCENYEIVFFDNGDNGEIDGKIIFNVFDDGIYSLTSVKLNLVQPKADENYATPVSVPIKINYSSIENEDVFLSIYAAKNTFEKQEALVELLNLNLVNTCLQRADSTECSFEWNIYGREGYFYINSFLINQNNDSIATSSGKFIVNDYKIYWDNVIPSVIVPSLNSEISIDFNSEFPSLNSLDSYTLELWLDKDANLENGLGELLDSKLLMEICSDEDFNSASLNICSTKINFEDKSGNFVLHLKVKSNEHSKIISSNNFVVNEMPKVMLLNPNGGETLEDEYNLQFKVYDLDSNNFNFSIYYSEDKNNLNEKTIVANALSSEYCEISKDENNLEFKICTYNWIVPSNADSALVYLNVLVDDSYSVGSDFSDSYVLLNLHKPFVEIISPMENENVIELNGEYEIEFNVVLADNVPTLKADIYYSKNKNGFESIISQNLDVFSCDLIDINGIFARNCKQKWDLNLLNGEYFVDLLVYTNLVETISSTEKFQVNAPIVELINPVGGEEITNNDLILFKMLDPNSQNLNEFNVEVYFSDINSEMGEKLYSINLSEICSDLDNDTKTFNECTIDLENLTIKGEYYLILKIVDLETYSVVSSVKPILFNDHRPIVELIQPLGNEIITSANGNYLVKFNTYDEDISDTLIISIILETMDEERIIIAKDLNFNAICENADNSLATPNECSYEWDTKEFTGKYTLSVEVNDLYATRIAKSESFIIDNSPPKLISVLPISDTNSNIFFFEFTEEGTGLNIETLLFKIDGLIPNNFNIDDCNSTENLLQCEYVSDIADGNHSFSVSIKDKTGYLAEYNLDYLYDKTSPIINFIYPTLNFVVLQKDSLTVTYEGTDETSGIKRYLLRLGEDRLIDNDLNTSYTFENISPSTYELYLIAEDNVGNRAEKIIEVELKKVRTVIIDENIVEIVLEELPIEQIQTKEEALLSISVVERNLKQLDTAILRMSDFLVEVPSDVQNTLNEAFLELIQARIIANQGNISLANSKIQRANELILTSYANLPRPSIVEKAILEYKASSKEVEKLINLANLTPIEVGRSKKLTKDLNFTKEMLTIRLRNNGQEEFFTLIKLRVNNISDEHLENLILIEEIPKRFAQTANVVKSTKEFLVVLDDPVLKWYVNNISPEGFSEISYKLPSKLDANDLFFMSSPVLTKRDDFLWFQQIEQDTLYRFTGLAKQNLEIPKDANLARIGFVFGTKGQLPRHPIKIRFFKEDTLIESYESFPQNEIGWHFFGLTKPLELTSGDNVSIEFETDSNDFYYILTKKWFLENKDDPWTRGEFISSGLIEEYDAVFKFYNLKVYEEEIEPEIIQNEISPITPLVTGTPRSKKGSNFPSFEIALLIIGIIIFAFFVMREGHNRRDNIRKEIDLIKKDIFKKDNNPSKKSEIKASKSQKTKLFMVKEKKNSKKSKK